ncbi:hypothetical protein MKEN_00095200 [Mycena kentingensis (nom. inval.)]|nr:hypothetical protein MKEN_00095200 [Mycena kentingensis (nom. inval.)]
MPEVIDLTLDADTPPPPPSRKRKRIQDDQAEPRRHKRDSEAHPRNDLIANDQLFFVDCTPSEVPSGVRFEAATSTSQPKDTLILPAHVAVFGETEPIIPPEHTHSDEEDYIEYLDNDSRKHFVRYYEEAEEKPARVHCKRCGDEGHTKDSCTTLICQTCGVRDAHPTRSCNVSKHCFTCGMRGHINRDCPNRHQARYERIDSSCERCGAPSHVTRECPTLWRLYVYLDRTQHEKLLEDRRSKKGLPLGQGGEGYIAEDAWCHNCGHRGHFGDDCQQQIAPAEEYSIFSHRVFATGPFAAPDIGSGSPGQSIFKVALPGGVENIGKLGRNKQKERLVHQSREEEPDADDWFQNRGGVSIRGAASREKERERGGGLPKSRAPQISFSRDLKDRLSEPQRPLHHRNSKPRRDEYDSRSRNDHKHPKGPGNWDRRERERDLHKPRYNGGYGR